MHKNVTAEGIEYVDYSVYLKKSLEAIFDFFGGDWSSIADTFSLIWSIYSLIAILLALLFFIGYIYAKLRSAQLFEEAQAALRATEAAWANKHANPETRNERWNLIQQRVTEESPESWRVAIIEADIMLDETLTNAGYVGQSLGEKLKGANPQSFSTLQDAWEAHKVRNEIAHVGSDFILTKRSAQDTITLYGRVFQEFGVI